MITAPAPWDWATDATTTVARAGAAMVFDGATTWVLDGVASAASATFDAVTTATTPQLTASWFTAGPFRATAAIAATVLTLSAFAAIVHGTLHGDPGGMLRHIAVGVPSSVLAITAIVGVTTIALQLTDAVSAQLLTTSGADARAFAEATAGVARAGGTQPSFVVMLLALVGATAGAVVVAELVVRAALIYLIVALAPLAFAVQVWPALRGLARRLIELLAAIVLSKLIIAIALSVAAAGLAATGDRHAIAPPGEPAGAAATTGLLFAAVAAFVVAAFSPAVVLRLLPITEAAVITSGVRAAGTRAAQRGLTFAATGGRASNLHALATRPHTTTPAAATPPRTPPPPVAPPKPPMTTNGASHG